ncbi:hypothetical protein [Solidesulfovibrio magneticus]|uniref:Universal stress protein n=1 Tax=Solidesulfovibrio magneticus (strain ATCC 700980 / DSM 13731 / RS-1) TaxID=573370 RepID=C4XL35_SOLM1|nr:hypothetical protein [Solidesulfovibrio magneticus]BAH74574.1 hypothetical protein DMR_10830 [Solidesulfovibrio magneticus RS-1]
MVKREKAAALPGTRLGRPSRLRRFLEDTAQDVGLAEHGLSLTGEVSGPLGQLALSEAGSRFEPMPQGAGAAEGKKIVAVSTAPEFPLGLVRRALGVAGRLGTDIVGLTVAAPAEGGASGRGREAFLRRAKVSAREFAREAERLGLGFRHVVCFGRPAEVVEQECGRLRRVEFVLAAREQRARDGFAVSMPLFEVTG